MEIRVKDMMCDNCRKKILSALEKAEIEAEVDLAKKVVIVEDEAESEAKAIISLIGYKVE